MRRRNSEAKLPAENVTSPPTTDGDDAVKSKLLIVEDHGEEAPSLPNPDDERKVDDEDNPTISRRAYDGPRAQLHSDSRKTLS